MRSLFLIAIATLALTLSGCNDAASGTMASKESMVSWNDPQEIPVEKTSGLLSLPAKEESEDENILADIPVKERNNGCDRMFLGGMRPYFVDRKISDLVARDYDELCYRAFSVGHAGRLKIPAWSAEMLDPSRMALAARMSRNSEFVPDPNLIITRRAVDADYRRSKMDRGHMAPSADMPSMEAQAESFYFSNIAPQNPHLNGGKWAELESNLRQMARSARIYVVTGPIIQNSRASLRKRVLIPTAFYKAFFAVDRGAVVFVATNERFARWSSYSVDQFTAIYGIDPFPAMPLAVRKHNLSIGAFPDPDKKDEKDPKPGKNSAKPSDSKKSSSARLNGENGTGVWISIEAFEAEYGRPPRQDEYIR